MTYKIGWFSTGRDLAARELLKIVIEKTRSGFIPGELSFVFVSREKGEKIESDKFIELVESYELDLVCFSSKKFEPELWESGKTDNEKLIQWREAYDSEVYERTNGFDFDIIVLAGYMLIVGETLCDRYDMVNLHPAKPDGPKGSWQDVIWELIETGAVETGVMMHLVTKDLDRGPPITYCSFPIRDGIFSGSFADLGKKLENKSLAEIQKEEDETEPYFKLVRDEGVKRELPLIIFTLRSLANGKVQIRSKNIFEGDTPVIGGFDLTNEIESYLDEEQS